MPDRGRHQHAVAHVHLQRIAAVVEPVGTLHAHVDDEGIDAVVAGDRPSLPAASVARYCSRSSGRLKQETSVCSNWASAVPYTVVLSLVWAWATVIHASETATAVPAMIMVFFISSPVGALASALCVVGPDSDVRRVSRAVCRHRLDSRLERSLGRSFPVGDTAPLQNRPKWARNFRPAFRCLLVCFQYRCAQPARAMSSTLSATRMLWKRVWQSARSAGSSTQAKVSVRLSKWARRVTVCSDARKLLAK